MSMNPRRPCKTRGSGQQTHRQRRTSRCSESNRSRIQPRCKRQCSRIDQTLFGDMTHRTTHDQPAGTLASSTAMDGAQAAPGPEVSDSSPGRSQLPTKVSRESERACSSSLPSFTCLRVRPRHLIKANWKLAVLIDHSREIALPWKSAAELRLSARVRSRSRRPSGTFRASTC